MPSASVITREMRTPVCGGVEVADGQPGHVPLHPHAHLGDGALRRHPQHLRQRETGAGLDDGGPGREQGEGQEEIGPAPGR